MATGQTALQNRKRDINSNINGPGTGAFAITPTNATPLNDGASAVVVRGVYVAVSGHIAGTVLNRDGTDSATVTFSNVPVGIIEVAFTQIHSTGTTATGLIGLQ